MALEMVDTRERLYARNERASLILQPYTSHAEGKTPIQKAVNDAFNVLQWGRTAAEEREEEAAEKSEGGE